jgi:hypothetical protein
MPISFLAFTRATWIWLTQGSSMGVSNTAATFSGSAATATGATPMVIATTRNNTDNPKPLTPPLNRFIPFPFMFNVYVSHYGHALAASLRPQ